MPCTPYTPGQRPYNPSKSPLPLALLQNIRGRRKICAIEMLGRGADLDAEGRYGPALTQDIREGSEPLADELLERGRNPTVGDRYRSAFTQVIEEGFVRIASKLTQNGADLNVAWKIAGVAIE